MSPRGARIAWSVVLLSVAGLCIGFSLPENNAQQETATKSPPAETLLPADSFLYIGADGRDAHRAEFEQTAAYEAIYKSGLAEVFGKVVGYVLRKVNPGDNANGLQLFKQAYSTISKEGLSVAVSLRRDAAGPPQPWSIIVFHEAGKLEPHVGGAIKKLGEGKLTFETKTVSNRTITRADIPAPDAPFPLEIGWWTEGNHLVLVGGAKAVERAVAVADGKQPNITTHRLWKKYRDGQTDFTVSTVGWFDMQSLRTMFGGMPIPETRTVDNPATVNDMLAVAGLDNADALVGRSGYKGRATWSETVLEAPGAKKGLLSLIAQKPITLNDLPPLPAKMNGLYACSIDWSQTYNKILGMVRKGAKLGPPGTEAEVEGNLDQLPAMIGFDPQRDLLDTLGNVFCAYDDPGQGPFGIGAGVVIKVKDANRLRRTIDDLIERAGDAAPPGQVKVWRKNKYGRQIVTVEIGNGMFNPSFAITENWMCIGFYPQTVEAFLLRLDDKLPTWKPGPEYQAGLKELPAQFSSITISDPRETYRMLLGLAPWLYSMAKFGLSQSGVQLDDLPVALSDLPPAEVVTRPLFPNIAVRTVHDDGIRWTSRASLPGFFGADTVTVSAVAVALLLPAVQQAREAARRATSKNNLKQIGLALHNYHDVHGHFPYGTVQTPGLKPKERLSWMASVLPFLEQQPLHRQLDGKKGWEDDANPKVAKTTLDVFQNPHVAVDDKPKYGTTHYVGIAGVGKNSLTTTKLDKKVGIFGYNRRTRLRDITDGTSNTMMVSEASKNYGPWAAGGPSTIRAFTKKPYINGPDGIGGPFKGGCHVLFADGSVRFISEKTDPQVIEALATMRGGEAVRHP